MRARVVLVGTALAIAVVVIVAAWRTAERPVPSDAAPPAVEPAAPPVPRPVEIDGVISDLALSPDGTFAVAVTYHSPTHSMDFGRRDVRLVDVGAANKSVKPLRWDGSLTGTPRGVAISPDGKRVAVAITIFDGGKAQPDVRAAYTNAVGIWDTATGRRTATLTGSKAHQLDHVAFSPDGRHVAAAAVLLNATAQSDGGGVVVWDAGTGRVAWGDLRPKAVPGPVAFSPDGKLVAAGGGDRTVRVWEAPTGKPVRVIETPGDYAYSLSFSPDGRLLAGGGVTGAVRVWVVATGVEQRVLTGFKERRTYLDRLIVRFLPDGTLLTAGAAEAGDGSLKAWDVETGTRVWALAEPNTNVWGMDTTADGRTALVGTGSDEQKVLIVPLGK